MNWLFPTRRHWKAVIWIAFNAIAMLLTLACFAAAPDVASPLVSYQYLDLVVTPPDQPNVISPVVSYQFVEWPTNMIPQPLTSLPASYFYGFGTGAVVILKQPLSQFVQSGATAKFTVGADGQSPLNYQWLFAGNPLAGATGDTLTIAPVNIGREGAYSVRIFNASSSVASVQAYLRVLPDMGILTTLQPTYSEPPANAPGKSNLIVCTHGWNPDVTWLDSMTNAIQKYLDATGLDNWQVIAHKWVEKATTGSALFGGPGKALLNGESEGGILGKRLAAQRRWRHIHFIGHSAGAGLIQAATTAIKDATDGWPTTIVHTTFLDPYVGFWNDDRRHKYGLGADWADNYFSQDVDTESVILNPTEGLLSNAYNVNVTWLDTHKKPLEVYASTSLGDVVVQTCYQTVTSHGWPRDFYTNTVPPNNVLGSEGVGFPLSKEGGNWDYATNHYGRGDSLELGSSEPVCFQGTELRDLTRVTVDLDLTPTLESPSGTVRLNQNSVGLITDSPAWLSIGVTVTNKVNFVCFDAQFVSTNAFGLLTVYWGTNALGVVDERAVLSGLQHYSFALHSVYGAGLYTLGFRLDPFSPTSSSIVLTNIEIQFAGVNNAFSLSATAAQTNGLRVLQLTGPASQTYLVEGSSDLVNWETVAVLVNTNGIVRFVDSASTTLTSRFYRAVAP